MSNDSRDGDVSIALDPRSRASNAGILIPRRTLIAGLALAGVLTFSLLVAVSVTASRVHALRSSSSSGSAAGSSAAAGSGGSGGAGGTAKNVIFFVTDGMGPASVSAARAVAAVRGAQQQRQGAASSGFDLVDALLVGSSQTRSANSPVTDSAAGATALSTGFRTWNGRDAVDDSATSPLPLGTLLQAARLDGRATGVVVTTDVTDATPGSFSANAVYRKLEDLIADQQSTSGLDVLMGGGRKFFEPLSRADGRDLIAEMKAKGYTVATDAQGLRDAPRGDAAVPFLGLYAERDMAFEIDRDPGQQPSLSEMTERALDMLSSTAKARDHGFFVLVEASRIDHAGHSNDIAANVGDTLEWTRALAVARAFAERDGSTLVFSTSDHETGGLTLGGGAVVARNTSQHSRFGGLVGAGDATAMYAMPSASLTRDRLMVQPANLGFDNVYPYFWNVPFVSSVKHSSNFVADKIMAAMTAAAGGQQGKFTVLDLAATEALLQTHLGLTDALLPAEWDALQTAMDICATRTCVSGVDLTLSEREYGRAVEYAINAIVSRRANVDWTTHAHTAIDVNVYAYGTSAATLAGSRPNYRYSGLIAAIAGLDLAAASAQVQSTNIGKCPYKDARCAPDTT
jgi:alkaline phosphatase